MFTSANANAKAPQAEKPVVKRGALCVDEVQADAPNLKRQRYSKRDVWSTEAIQKLMAEATSVINKLLVADGRTCETPKSGAGASSKPLDPRLQNLEFVRAVALRKYVKSCAEGRQTLNLSTLHDVCIHANEFVRQQRQLAAARSAASVSNAKKNACFSGQVKDLAAKLIVTLWRAACATPYMKDNKKGGDSFRPFSAGCCKTPLNPNSNSNHGFSTP